MSDLPELSDASAGSVLPFGTCEPLAPHRHAAVPPLPEAVATARVASEHAGPEAYPAPVAAEDGGAADGAAAAWRAPLAPAESPSLPPGISADAQASPLRKRPRPGERRVQILQTLASMLEQPGAERITTAALAARLQVSEAALYRHFSSKAQMFEGLIEFIESSVFSLVNQITEREADGLAQARRITWVLLQFGEKNPGMVRLMVGDALVFEHERLITRMNQFFDRVEGQLRQSLRVAQAAEGPDTAGTTAHWAGADAQALASGLVALAMGRLQRYVRSGFKRPPTEHLEPVLARLAA